MAVPFEEDVGAELPITALDNQQGVLQTPPVQQQQGGLQTNTPPVQQQNENISGVSATTTTISEQQDSAGFSQTSLRQRRVFPSERRNYANVHRLDEPDHQDRVLEAIREENLTKLRCNLRKLHQCEFQQLVFQNLNFHDLLAETDNPHILRVILNFLQDETDKKRFLVHLKLDGTNNIFQTSVIKGNFSIFSFLLNLGIYDLVHCVTLDGDNIMHLAVYHKCTNLVAIILQEGIIGHDEVIQLITASNGRLELPLHIAARQAYLEILKLFMLKGVSLESKTGDGSTPIICAAKSMQLDAVALLAQNGANVNARDRDEKSLIDFLRGNCRIDLLRLLMKSGLQLTSEKFGYFEDSQIQALLNSNIQFDTSRQIIYFDSIFINDVNKTGLKNILALEDSLRQPCTGHVVVKLYVDLQFHIMQKILNGCINYATSDEIEMSLKSKAEMMLTLNTVQNNYDASSLFRTAINAQNGFCIIETPRNRDVDYGDYVISREYMEELKALNEARQGVPSSTNIAPP